MNTLVDLGTFRRYTPTDHPQKSFYKAFLKNEKGEDWHTLVLNHLKVYDVRNYPDGFTPVFFFNLLDEKGIIRDIKTNSMALFPENLHVVVTYDPVNPEEWKWDGKWVERYSKPENFSLEQLELKVSGKYGPHYGLYEAWHNGDIVAWCPIGPHPKTGGPTISSMGKVVKNYQRLGVWTKLISWIEEQIGEPIQAPSFQTDDFKAWVAAKNG